MAGILEHVNVTVSDPAATAALYGRLFGWAVRWKGASMNGGHTVHVGTAVQYVALYRGKGDQVLHDDGDRTCGALNHIALVVDDLEATESLVRAEGLTTLNHADYDPGRRFYFHDSDGIEYEVVSYS